MKQVDPFSLLTPVRYDYVVKYRFFRHLMHGDDPESERVYRWHVFRRTGGVEKGSWKRTVDDYVDFAPKLLESVQKQGFLAEFCIEIGANSLILHGTGAHRIAVCMALDVPIWVRVHGDEGRSRWDRDWFRFHGMPADDLVRLDADWSRLRAIQSQRFLTA